MQTGLWLAAQQLAVRIAGRRRPRPLTAALGAGCLVAGGGLAGQSFVSFRRLGTTWHPWAPEETTALVTDGANAITRNPMYAGMALVLVGSGLLSGRPWSALAAAGLMAALTPQIRREEAALAEIFGDEWTAYTRRVRRWI